MTNKFLLYDLQAGGFLSDDGDVRDNDIQNAAIFSIESARERRLDATDETAFLSVPMTEDYINRLPFDLTDTDPEKDFSESLDRAAALSGDFVVLTDMGFYDEKYNSITESSRPKVRSFELDYANLYNQKQLEELNRDWIIGDEDIIVPISAQQQEALKQLPAFDPRKEPHGFFMEPLPDTPRQEQEQMPSLEDSLGALETPFDTMEQ